MAKIAVVLAALAFTVLRPVQAQDLEAERLARTLSWSSVGSDCVATFLFVFPTGAEAERLLAIGRRAIPSLVAVLEDPERGVAAHLILTKMLRPENDATGVAYHYVSETPNPGSELTGWTYRVNGLSWDWVAKGDRSTVEDAELKMNSSRWREALNL